MLGANLIGCPPPSQVGLQQTHWYQITANMFRSAEAIRVEKETRITLHDLCDPAPISW